jgi:hypothetical protein
MQMKLKLTVAAAIAAVASMAGAQDVQVVKIGHVAPMSGSQAHYGKDNENGVRMAIEDLNTQNIQRLRYPPRDRRGHQPGPDQARLQDDLSHHRQ